MIKKIIKDVFKKFNLEIVPHHLFQYLKASEGDLSQLMRLPNEQLEQLVPLIKKSNGQLKQDLFVLLELNFKRNGFFVEFGATNGIDLSNTYLLEKEFNWNGILAEPAKNWHDDLKTNRTCSIETACVWRDSKSILDFSESNVKELSTISEFKNSDVHKKLRRNSTTYKVNTISLNDLLDKYNAPKIIDYLSIDTEGSEYEILSNFDFSRYKFRVITCEHNFTANRDKIFELLTKNGYTRKYLGFSKWDDWYVLLD